VLMSFETAIDLVGPGIMNEQLLTVSHTVAEHGRTSDSLSARVPGSDFPQDNSGAKTV
jgi:hypothetical protein